MTGLVVGSFAVRGDWWMCFYHYFPHIKTYGDLDFIHDWKVGKILFDMLTDELG